MARAEGEALTKERAWARWLRAHTRALERVEAALAAHDLPPLAWYDVLWALDQSDDRRLRMRELADEVLLSRSNLTRLVDRMEHAKLVRRIECAEDKRGAFCELTRSGAETRRRMWPVYRRAIDSFFARHVTSAEARLLTDVFARVAAAEGKVEPRTRRRSTSRA